MSNSRYESHLPASSLPGLASDFVDGSMRMGASDARTKHLIGTPVVTFNADATRAIVETNAKDTHENWIFT